MPVRYAVLKQTVTYRDTDKLRKDVILAELMLI